MYIKLPGMVCLFIFSVLFSRSITRKIKNRLLELEEINRILNDFIVSINVGLYDVNFLITEAIKITKTTYHDFLRDVKTTMIKKDLSDFSAIWFECLNNHKFNISREEMILLENIGVSLSFNDKNRIVKQLTLIQSGLTEAIKKAKEDRDSKVSLYEKMGVLFGSFLVVIFI